MKFVMLAATLWAVISFGGEPMSDSKSPDGRLGVMEPVEGGTHNQLVELKTGRMIAEIEGQPGLSGANHVKTIAVWAPDSRRLLWIVDGKWGPSAMTVVELDEKDAAKQTNVLKAAQEQLLTRTRKAHPKSYAAAKKWNKGNGAAYPDGFTIGAIKPGSANLPIRFTFALTSNPKQIEDRPQLAQLDAYIEGTLKPGQKLEWANFRSWDADSGEREHAESEGAGEGLAQLEDEIETKLKGAAKTKFNADREAWGKAQMRQLGEGSELEALSSLETSRRSSAATNKRIADLQKRYGVEN